jgi:predicted  nucleic acid-binding Zn-ribbon protein|tara:strand:- start:311 stop:538 length:228 start_codon:yes stop_codon:yes gene_type:complete
MANDKKDTWKYREELQTAIHYIKEKVDENHIELKGINGRLRDAEKEISSIKSFGKVIGTIFTGTIAFLFKKQIGG